jgi:hypothetical protein
MHKVLNRPLACSPDLHFGAGAARAFRRSRRPRRAFRPASGTCRLDSGMATARRAMTASAARTRLLRGSDGRAVTSLQPEEDQKYGDPEHDCDEVEDVNAVTADPDPRATWGRVGDIADPDLGAVWRQGRRAQIRRGLEEGTGGTTARGRVVAAPPVRGRGAGVRVRSVHARSFPEAADREATAAALIRSTCHEWRSPYDGGLALMRSASCDAHGSAFLRRRDTRPFSTLEVALV